MPTLPNLPSLPTLAEMESAARLIREAMPPTPLYRWPLLCERLGAEVWLKHENHAPIGAFKLRGGLVYLAELARGSRVRAVVTATRGNHGQSVALSAHRHGIAATVVVPIGNSAEKNAAMRALGAELIEHGADFQAAREHAERLAASRGAHLVPSFHPLLVRGVATLALELLGAIPQVDLLYVPIGLGSGICGAVAARNALGARMRIIGVVSAQAPAYARSFAERRAVACEATTRLADGMACRVPQPEALEVIWSEVERIVEVSDAEVADAMRLIHECTHNGAEGAGAAAVAAMAKERGQFQGRQVAGILTGGNVDREVMARVLAGGSS